MESESNLAQAEESKMQGNEDFKSKINKIESNYEKAVKHYTHSIELLGNHPKSAIYYSNRANCHLKMENYGLAINDADLAIEIDPKYAKSYFRKADAQIILNHYEEALKSLKKVDNFLIGCHRTWCQR